MTRTLWSVALAAVTVFATASATQAQGGQGRFGFGGRRPLLRIPEVHRELKLEQAQIDRLNALPQNRISREEFQNLSPEERQKRITELRTERDKQVAVILKPEQVARLKQLELQDAGVSAIADKDVADKLQLTADQRAKIQAVQQENRDAIRQAFQAGGQDTPEQRRARMRELRTQAEAKLNAILTDAQKKQFQEMQGPAFTFPERQRGGANN